MEIPREGQHGDGAPRLQDCGQQAPHPPPGKAGVCSGHTRGRDSDWAQGPPADSGKSLMCVGESLYQGKVPDLSRPALETHVAAAGAGLALRGPAHISSTRPPPIPARRLQPGRSFVLSLHAARTFPQAAVPLGGSGLCRGGSAGRPRWEAGLDQQAPRAKFQLTSDPPSAWRAIDAWLTKENAGSAFTTRPG